MELRSEYHRLRPTFSQEGQAFVETLLDALEAQQTQLTELKRAVFGQKAEPKPRLAPPPKPPPTEAELARREEERLKTRLKNQQERAKLPTEQVVVPLPAEAQVCPHCQGTTFRKLPDGERKIEYDFVQAQLKRRDVVREKWACACGKCILTAPPGPTVGTGSAYTPALHAHIVVAKCADSLPLYRQEKILARAGVAVDRNTLIALFHRCAHELKPLYQRLVALIPQYALVHADETTLKVQAPGQGKCKTGWIWTFLAGPIALYVYRDSRCGQTPTAILGESEGILQVDGYSGYNEVTEAGRRERAGCWAHVRRKFWPVLETDGKAQAEHALEQIAKLYQVEHQVVEKGVRGSRLHQQWRQEQSRPVVEKLLKWATEQAAVARPKSALKGALTYLLNQAGALRTFLDNPAVSLDNNASERALRVVAVGRKNFLFAGSDEGAENLGILQSLVGTCLANDVNPERYLTDVLLRVQTWPAAEVDALLPWQWHPPTG